MMLNPKVILWLFALNLIVSGLALRGYIDKDFFSFYFVGKMMYRGARLYTDIVDNKGPVLYLFFTSLFSFFRNNYGAALSFLMIVVDYLAVILSWILFRLFYHKRISDTEAFFVGTVVFFLYKAFNLGSQFFGFYSESLAYIFLVLAFILCVRKRIIFSIVFFMFSFLSRQTFLVFWVPYVFLLFNSSKLTISNIKSFLLRFLGVGLLVGSACLVLFRPFDFFYATVSYNIHYAQAVSSFKLTSLLLRLVEEPKIIFLSFGLLGVGVYAVRKIHPRVGIWCLFLFLAGIAPLVGGGKFYLHHFMQLVPFALIFYAWAYRYFQDWFKVVGLLFVVASMLSIVVNSLHPSNYFYSLERDPIDIPALHESSYMTVMPHYSRFYLDFPELFPPDKYFHKYYLLKSYNSAFEIDKRQHESMSPQLLQNTIFLLADTYPLDTQDNAEYLQTYDQAFHLNLLSEIVGQGFRIQLYKSKF